MKEVETIGGAKKRMIDSGEPDKVRTIKKALDPHLILNPGKLFTADGNELELLDKTEEDFHELGTSI